MAEHSCMICAACRNIMAAAEDQARAAMDAGYAQGVENTMASASRRIGELESSLTATQGELAREKIEVDTVRGEMHRYRSRWEKAGAELAHLKHDLGVAHRVVENHKKKVDEAVRIGCENIAMREKAEAQSDVLAADRDVWMVQAKKAEAKLVECLCWESDHCPLHSIGIAEVEARVLAANRRAEKAEADLAAAKWDLSVKEAEREGTSTACADLRAERAALKQKYDELHDQRFAEARKVDALKTQLAESSKMESKALQERDALRLRVDALKAELAKAKEDDRRHALVCPQHVKNVDPWVRQSALDSAQAEIADLKAKLADAKESANAHRDAQVVAEAALPRLTEALKKAKATILLVERHAPGYDWNADEFYLTREIGDRCAEIDSLVKEASL